MRNRFLAVQCLLLFTVISVLSTQALADFGDCEVRLHGWDNGATQDQYYKQRAFPLGVAKTFRSAPGEFEKFVSIGFDVESALMIARLVAHPKRFALRVGVDELANLGLTEADLVDYSEEDLLNLVISHVKRGGPTPWDQTRWNDKMESVHFSGSCDDAIVYLYEHKDFGGTRPYPHLS